MTKNEIIRSAEDFCAKNSTKKVEYRLCVGEEQRSKDPSFGGRYDSKLDEEAYLNNSFTVVARNKSDMSFLGRTTLFLMGYDVYKDIFFWKLHEDEEQTFLLKVWLGECKDLIGDLCITLGFTEIAGEIRFSPDLAYQYKTGMDLFGFVKQLVSDSENFVYLAPLGEFSFDEETLSLDKVILFPEINVSEFGAVHPEGWAKAKLAQKLKMCKVDNLYGNDDLGPVFFSKEDSKALEALL
ncbi:MAG: hypothetical protein FWG14_08425 [Peptococcaceae bacterium]|nr:hypothetical protein [Peptococcaceae bacterium]